MVVGFIVLTVYFLKSLLVLNFFWSKMRIETLTFFSNYELKVIQALMPLRY